MVWDQRRARPLYLAVLMLMIVGPARSIADTTRSVAGIFQIKIDTAADPAETTALATTVSGPNALALRCVHGELHVVLSSVSFGAGEYQHFDVAFQTDQKPVIIEHALGANDTGLGSGAFDIADAGQILDNMIGAKLAYFRITSSEASGVRDVVFPLFAQADDAVAAIKKACGK